VVGVMWGVGVHVWWFYCREGLEDDSVLASTAYGGPVWFANTSVLDDGGTSHISTVDAQRMGVSMTTTINLSWGSMVYSKSTGAEHVRPTSCQPLHAPHPPGSLTRNIQGVPEVHSRFYGGLPPQSGDLVKLSSCPQGCVWHAWQHIRPLNDRPLKNSSS
jgi:hypothetical protein